MSQQIKKKFIEANAIDGSKLLLSSDEAIRSKNSSGVEVDLIKLDVSNKLQLLSAPYVGPLSTDELANKGYVDQKVADLVASAPAVLDTLKELADAIGDDPNFAATVSGQVGTVQTNLDNEVSRATLAEADLQSQITALSGSSGSSLAQEILDRIADVDAEEAARIAEDLTFVKLDGSRALPGSLDFESPSDLLTVSPNGIHGGVGLYIDTPGTLNMASTEASFNVTAFSGIDLSPGAGQEVFIHEQLNMQAAKIVNMAAGVASSDAATKGQLDTAVGTLESEDLTFVKLDGSRPMTGDLDIAGHMINHANQIYGDGQVDIYAQSGDVILTGANTATVTSENGDVYINATSGNIGLSAVEVFLDSGPLNMMTNRILQVASAIALDDAVNLQQLQNAVSTEETRAMGAESALDARLDIIEGPSSQVGSIAKAEADAKAYADQKVADLVNGAPALLDTLKELADAINDDASFATTVANNIASVQSAVDAEETRAMGIESGLQSELDATQIGAGLGTNGSYSAPGVSNYLSSAVSLKDADSKLDTQIKVVADGLAQEILDRVSDVNTEESRAMAAESALDARVVALEGVAVQFESEKFTLTGTDITNGYIDLVHIAVAKSMNAFVDRLAIFETDDYTLSVVSGKTRVTFAGSLITPGQEKLSSGDVVRVKYAYEVL